MDGLLIALFLLGWLCVCIELAQCLRAVCRPPPRPPTAAGSDAAATASRVTREEIREYMERAIFGVIDPFLGVDPRWEAKIIRKFNALQDKMILIHGRFNERWAVREG